MTAKPTDTFRTTVPPRHCDAQGAMHASRYYEYFEDACLHWLDIHVGRSSQPGYAVLRDAGVDLVVVSSRCDHHGPVLFGDTLAIEMRPVAVGRTSLTIRFAVENSRGIRSATGHTTYIASLRRTWVSSAARHPDDDAHRSLGPRTWGDRGAGPGR